MDIYKKLAAEELGISEEQVTPEQRHFMKQRMFLNTYGDLHPSLNGEMNINMDFADLYERMMSGEADEKMEQIKEFIKSNRRRNNGRK